MHHRDGRQVDTIQATGVNGHHVVARRCYALAKWRTPALWAVAMLNGVFVECVCAHAVLGAEQTKILTGYKPVKRTTLATNRTVALHNFLWISFGFERDLPTVATTFVYHRIAPFS
jgi:hypothetical protein